MTGHDAIVAGLVVVYVGTMALQTVTQEQRFRREEHLAERRRKREEALSDLRTGRIDGREFQRRIDETCEEKLRERKRHRERGWLAAEMKKARPGKAETG